ncbi:MAG: SpoIIE family protein phosphatase [Planctomycetota bacterium]
MTQSPPTSTPPMPALTDLVERETLQDIQDNFAAFARLQTEILDPAGAPITTPTDVGQRAASDMTLQLLIESEQEQDGSLHAPIIVEGQTLGTIVVRPDQIAPSEAISEEDRERMLALCDRLQIKGTDRDDLLRVAEDTYAAKVGASIQFLYLIANSIARLCSEQHQSAQRVRELSALYDVASELAGQRELSKVLDTATHTVAKVLSVRAVVIRLLRDRGGKPELPAESVYGISNELADMGRTLVNKSELTRKALTGEMVYIADMTTDERSFYPEDCKREGVVSMLSTGLMYQGRGIGTIQLFTDAPRSFTPFEENLTRAISQLVATAIRSAQLIDEQSRSRAIVRQVKLASDVQRRMLPQYAPELPGYDIAGCYVPSHDLGGDFYDYMNLEGSLGLAMGDVVGKGVAASLLMAHVRASLRAYAHGVYDLDQVMQRVNHALTRDTRDNEFATLWYGTLDPESRRLTYCNAGHEPGLLLRGDEIIPLDIGGMVVGVLSPNDYDKGIIDLTPGDRLLLHSDGLPDAMDPDDRRFGRERTERVLAETRDLPAKEALKRILHEVDQHRRGRQASDDTTIVLLRVLA